MAYKQPRVPEYRSADSMSGYMTQLVLFLKDFCLQTWLCVTRLQRAGDVLERVYPVGSVFIGTEDVNPAQRFGGEWTACEAASAQLGLPVWRRTA